MELPLRFFAFPDLYNNRYTVKLPSVLKISFIFTFTKEGRFNSVILNMSCSLQKGSEKRKKTQI